MAIQQLERIARIESGLRSERGTSEKRPVARESVESGGADDASGADAPVQISSQAERLRAQSQILQATFGGVEESNQLDVRDFFEAAGRSQYLESIEKPDDLSAEATAERILGGITGYIYGGFRLANPDATAEDFDRFASDVLRGFEQGMGEARGVIEGLSALSPELAKGIERTEALVREGLDVFFSDERRRILEGAPVADQ